MMQPRADLNIQEQLALSYYAAGRTYMMAVQMVGQHPEFAMRDENLTLPTHALMAFSVELFLKSVLAKQGMPQKELSAPALRHNLAELFTRATAVGLADCDPDRREMIGILAEQHAVHGYRYMKPGTVYRRVSLAAAHHVLERLNQAVAVLIDAEHMIAT